MLYVKNLPFFNSFILLYSEFPKLEKVLNPHWWNGCKEFVMLSKLLMSCWLWIMIDSEFVTCLILGFFYRCFRQVSKENLSPSTVIWWSDLEAGSLILWSLRTLFLTTKGQFIYGKVMKMASCLLCCNGILQGNFHGFSTMKYQVLGTCFLLQMAWLML